MEEKKIKAAKQLRADIQKKFKRWNERSNFILKGVKNLSVSDLETLELYADVILEHGYYRGILDPVGPIKEVLAKYELA